MNATACPTRDVLLAFHTGKLPEPAAEEIIVHLGQCAACEAILNSFGEAEDGLIARLRQPSVQGAYTSEPQYLQLVERAKALIATDDAEKTPHGHPTKEQLTAYARGEMGKSVANVVAEHVGQCADCEATLSNLGAEAGTAVGKRQGAAAQPPQVGNKEPRHEGRPLRHPGPQAQDLAPTELLGHSASPGSPPPTQLREYRILERLGAGGMGTVYKALHTKLDKLVALKVLPAAAMQDAELVARFEREMKAVGKLEHPNIVRAMDAGCHEGVHFLVMEYVDGLDLSEIVKRCGKLRIADACEVIRQAALGLAHADQHALVHRDIKPSNLVLNADGQVKILDLGLALLETDRLAGGELKKLQAHAAPAEATGAGRAMGTIDYMAPEQARDSHLVDIRADIYSLGCTFYKLLTGQAPFSGPKYENTFDKIMAHLSDPIPPVRHLRPDVPEKLVEVLDRMVAKDRDARYAKPSQLIDELKPFCPGCDLAGMLTHAQKGTYPVVAGAATPAASPERPRGAARAAPPVVAAGLATPPKPPTALGAGLPTPPKPPTARSPESPAHQPETHDPRRPVDPAKHKAGQPSPGAKPVAPPGPAPKPVSSSAAASPSLKVAAEEAFDPYYQWLAIPPEEQPPNHYPGLFMNARALGGEGFG